MADLIVNSKSYQDLLASLKKQILTAQVREFFIVNIRNDNATVAYIRCHAFRATDYLTNGGKLEITQRMAGHSNAKMTSLYHRRNADISVGEVERIGI